MPHSLRCKIKHLCHNGTITESERDRILAALEQEKILDKIKAEIMDCLNALDEIEETPFNIYLPNEISGRRLTYQQCLEFIDKYKEESEVKENG